MNKDDHVLYEMYSKHRLKLVLKPEDEETNTVEADKFVAADAARRGVATNNSDMDLRTLSNLKQELDKKAGENEETINKHQNLTKLYQQAKHHLDQVHHYIQSIEQSKGEDDETAGPAIASADAAAPAEQPAQVNQGANDFEAQQIAAANKRDQESGQRLSQSYSAINQKYKDQEQARQNARDADQQQRADAAAGKIPFFQDPGLKAIGLDRYKAPNPEDPNRPGTSLNNPYPKAPTYAQDVAARVSMGGNKYKPEADADTAWDKSKAYQSQLRTAISKDVIDNFKRNNPNATKQQIDNWYSKYGDAGEEDAPKSIRLR
jgi:hypothetical protein